jgi:hypothetical protein
MSEHTKPVLTVGDKYAFPWQGNSDDLALFAALGATIAEIQSFECHVVTMLGAIQGDLGNNSFFDRTLGWLIKTLREKFPDSEIDEKLEEVRSRRNRVVHAFLREYGWPMMRAEEYVQAIQDLEDTRAFIEHSSVELSRYLSDRSLVQLIVVRINESTGEAKRLV